MAMTTMAAKDSTTTKTTSSSCCSHNNNIENNSNIRSSNVEDENECKNMNRGILVTSESAAAVATTTTTGKGNTLPKRRSCLRVQSCSGSTKQQQQQQPQREPRGSQSNKVKLNRRVSFDTLHFHEHRITWSDHPSTTFGPPIQLSWDVECSYVISVEEYEQFFVEDDEDADVVKADQNVPLSGKDDDKDDSMSSNTSCGTTSRYGSSPPGTPIERAKSSRTDRAVQGDRGESGGEGDDQRKCRRHRRRGKELCLPASARTKMLLASDHTQREIERAARESRRGKFQRMHSVAMQDIEPLEIAVSSVVRKIAKCIRQRTKKRKQQQSNKKKQHSSENQDLTSCTWDDVEDASREWIAQYKKEKGHAKLEAQERMACEKLIENFPPAPSRPLTLSTKKEMQVAADDDTGADTSLPKDNSTVSASSATSLTSTSTMTSNPYIINNEIEDEEKQANHSDGEINLAGSFEDSYEEEEEDKLERICVALYQVFPSTPSASSSASNGGTKLAASDEAAAATVAAVLSPQRRQLAPATKSADAVSIAVSTSPPSTAGADEDTKPRAAVVYIRIPSKDCDSRPSTSDLTLATPSSTMSTQSSTVASRRAADAAPAPEANTDEGCHHFAPTSAGGHLLQQEEHLELVEC